MEANGAIADGAFTQGGERMKKAASYCVLMAVVLMLMAPASGLALDNGMEGLWTGEDSGGRITLMLGSGGTFISIYESDEIYRREGNYWVDQETMYLSDDDGNDTALGYGFSEGYLYLASDGDEVALQRQGMEGLSDVTGVWVSEGGDGLVAMDAQGGFMTVDAETGAAEQGIFLFNQGDILIALQRGAGLEMGFDVTDGMITLTNAETGETMTLIWYSSPSAE